MIQPFDIDLAWRMFFGGARYEDIAAHFGIAKSTVWRRMHPRPPSAVRRITDLERRVEELERRLGR